MRNYISVMFSDTTKAYEGLHALWLLDGAGEITVHGTAVVHRDLLGQFHVDTKETHPAFATAIGVGVGALLGVLAGPAGFAVGAAAGAAIGAGTGGILGAAVDMDRADTRNNVESEAEFSLGLGQTAVIADVSEDWTSPIDTRMRNLKGIVYRRAKSSFENAGWFGAEYLYPYEFVPSRDALWL